MLKNTTGIPLSVAVWLATDNYDHNANGTLNSKYISATGLLRPLRAIVLDQVLPKQEEDTDIVELIPSRLGTAVHDQIEAAWMDPKQALARLDEVGLWHNLTVNGVLQTDKFDSDNAFEVWMEQRAFKDIEDWTVGGKFDFVLNGELTDFKTTKTYSWISGSNTEQYILQGSIYRWLHSELITGDHLTIAYIFTDWIAQKALANKDYPQKPVIAASYPLKSIEDTERWIKVRLEAINQYIEDYRFNEEDQGVLPACTKEELWQNDPVYKYYKDPTKLTRSTKNFDNYADAQARKYADGVGGVVIEVPGEVKRCKYCNVRAGCVQAAVLTDEGLIK